jgi:RNA polymerase primary sigma factor
MPRVTTPRTEVIAELGEQLRFGSKKTLMRHLDRIEELAAQIEDDGLYPEDFVVFRISGYRPEVATPRMLPGAVLKGDLSALAERISESAGLTEDDLAGPCETVSSLTARWGVTRRTLERYRRLGLIARRVDLGSGRRALVFGRAGVEAFERRHAERLGRAARFGRLSDREVGLLERRAERYRSRLGWSLNRVAHRLAARTGRSPEGVRRVLRRVNESRADPIFPEPGPPTKRERLLAVRAAARGIEPAVLAQRTGRRRSAVRRALNDGRADLLRSLELPAGGPAVVAASVLGAGPARSGLAVEGPRELAGLMAQMRERVVPVGAEERSRAGAYRGLVASAGARIAGLPPATVSGAELDEIETMLRWAALLKAALVRTQLRLAIDTLEQRLGGPLEGLAPARARVLAIGLIGVVGDGVDRFDPARGGRLAGPVSLALGRWTAGVADVSAAPEPGRATRRTPSGVAVADWSVRVSPWQAWLSPDWRLAGVMGRLEGPDRALLAARFGLDGGVPRTLEGIAQSMGKRAVHLARSERRALRRALALVREAEAGPDRPGPGNKAGPASDIV